mgnify:FL=1|tara:strand:- start:2753 stop:3664 length:912 start_codon:yes stop_codon:yes gene_type:complete
MLKSPLKWIGGKSKLFDSISQHYPCEINNYHELFVGGGSALIGLLDMVKRSKTKINGKIYAYDSNKVLIEYYKYLQRDYNALFMRVWRLKNNLMYQKRKEERVLENKKEKDLTEEEKEILKKMRERRSEFYYKLRTIYNNKNLDEEKIAMFVFLNKTGFRGLFRLNKSGGYNVPYGNYDNPQIVDKEHLKNVSELIKDVEFICCDFEKVKNIKEDDFVYMDPPYVPENKGGFVSYSKIGFVKEKHEALFKLCNDMKCKWVLSNSNVEIVREALKKFNIEEIEARRAINSTNPGAKTKEVIIYN